MIRFAIPAIGGQEWFGGWMYMRNVVRLLALYGEPNIEVCLFIGQDQASDPFVSELRVLPRVNVYIDPAFDSERRRSGKARTILTGRKAAVLDIYQREQIDVALDWATYYGWNCEIPSIAWIPDFQHRALPHLFGRKAWFSREIGFRLQIAASSKILLSSAAAEYDCHRYYPASRGKTHVSRFAVPVDDWPEPVAAEQMLAKAGIPRDFVFMPNQLWSHKNHQVAIQAAALLAQRHSGRCIVATGRGSDPRRPSYRDELRAMIDQSKAGSNFLLLDGVDHELVKAMMVTTNALLNPSRFEGWSTTVEEAKAAGTPMLLSDLPVHREQAPGAMFFAPDDFQTLADLIEVVPIRTNETVQCAIQQARPLNLRQQKDFSMSVSSLVHKVASL